MKHLQHFSIVLLATCILVYGVTPVNAQTGILSLPKGKSAIGLGFQLTTTEEIDKYYSSDVVETLYPSIFRRSHSVPALPLLYSVYLLWAMRVSEVLPQVRGFGRFIMWIITPNPH